MASLTVAKDDPVIRKVERITMMEWSDSPTPSGRSASFALKPFDKNRQIAIAMIGEKQLAWLLGDRINQKEWRDGKRV